MALESATKLSELVATNPVSGDGVATGDDHIRLIKSVLLSLLSGTTFTPPAAWPAGLSQLGLPATLAGKAGQGLVVNGTEIGFTLSATSGSVPKSVQVFTATGTWTRPAGISKILITVIGGGASGGPGVANVSVGGGGGSGAKCEKLLDVTAIASAAVTIGSGGASVSSGVGNNGGDSSFSIYCTAQGGRAGSTITMAGRGGASGVGDVFYAGFAGGPGSTLGPQAGGSGGGPGGGPGQFEGAGLNAEPSSGGGGAGGGASSSTGYASGNGAAGYIVVYEYGA